MSYKPELEQRARIISADDIHKYGDALLSALDPRYHQLFEEVAAGIAYHALQAGRQDALKAYTVGYVHAINDIDRGQKEGKEL